jgi:hypothetical protein|uniref:hypothetical protein n=1 Tax=Altererythrobacter segetis TaxID=1104773 RepID=UPI001408D08F|nr:hypothetical protein [Altererythrobacter segetis]
MMPTNSAAGRAAVLAQYEAFAVQARSAAAAETLENVRRKHLTSALTWDHLAASARKMEQLRVRRMVEQLSAIAPTEPLRPSEHARVDDGRQSPTGAAIGKRMLIG